MSALDQNIADARSVDGIPFSDFRPPWTSVGELLAFRSVSSPESPWLIAYDDEDRRRQYSHAAFATAVYQVARFMRTRGVGKGDRVAILGHNHADTVIQYFAAWLLGSTVIPLNAGEDDDRLAYILQHSSPALLFVRTDYLDTWRRLGEQAESIETVVLAGDPGEEALPAHQGRFEEILRDGDRTPVIPRVYLLDEEALIVYTSGTTGAPKGVVLTHGNLLADALGIAAWHRVDESTRMMCVLPIHHVNGTVVTLLTPLVAGGSVVLNRKFRSGSFFSRIAADQVDIVSVVPTLLAYLLASDIDTADLDLSRLRHVICGAGPLTCELAERFEERYGVPIIHGYGLSETTCYSCFLPVDLSTRERRRWLTGHGFPSIGVPIPQNEMAIHDENGRGVPRGERGEIVIRGHNVMQGYFGNPEANAASFAHGWFRSGDEGFCIEGEEGSEYYFITGRLKELIIRGGVNLSPLEIDEVLNSHPDIEAAIAVGFENTWYGEEIGALVRRSREDLTEEEVRAWCAERLPFAKQPKVILFGEEIPVTSTGKYQRNRVRDLFGDYRETQFRPE